MAGQDRIAQGDGTRPFGSTIITNPAELRERRFEALVASLGWGNAVRFLQQCEVSRHDYTEPRDENLPNWDAETLVRLAKGRGEPQH